VDNWLETLPIAHIGETARQLYVAMRTVNRQEKIPVRHQFHMLEGIAEPLSLILPELHKHYAGKPLPLSKKRRKVADLYTQLLRQAIIGYQQIITHSIELNRFGWKKVVTTAVHRIFYYSALMLCNYRLLYLPYQKGMWQQLFWLYQLVEKYSLLNCKINCLDGRNTKSAIATEFKKLLLLSLLSPNLFKPAELQEIIDNMDIWVQHVTLTRSNKHDQHSYAFTLEADIPPGLVGDSIPGNDKPLIEVRYLDISELLQYLNRILTDATPGTDTVKLTRHRQCSRRALLIVLNTWGRPTSRDSERRLIQGEAEIAIGISAIHYLASDGRQPDKAEQKSDNSDIIVSNSKDISLPELDTDLNQSVSDFATQRDEAVDVWETIYFDPDPAPPSWTESIQMKVYSYLNARVLNISKNGFCVALPQDGIEHIQTNELIAIRGKRGQWQLGEIRWMVCPTSGAIRAGIKKHCQRFVPVQLHIQTGNHKTQPIRCLAGEKENGFVLFLPNLPTSLQGKEMSLEVGRKMRSFELQEQVYSSPVGSAYAIKWLDNKNAEAVKTTSAKQNSEYETIWASL
jgi:hypothetical protein